ncbi:MAG: hypothetical protein ACEQSB_00755 [Undibacterium sp.]
MKREDFEMAYVVFFKDPSKPGKIQAQAIKHGFACSTLEVRRELAIACGLGRKHRSRPESLVVDYGKYDHDDDADTIVEAHYAGSLKTSPRMSAFHRKPMEMTI